MDSNIENKHEEEHEDSKKERKVETTNWTSLNPLEAVKKKEWKEVVMKNNVCEKLWSIDRYNARLRARGFSQKEGEYYDDNLFQ